MNLSHLPSLLERVAALKRVNGEPEFKATAYDKASRALQNQLEVLADHLQNGTVTELPGIGKSLAAQITAYAETGVLPALEKLEASTPPGLLQWMNIPGLGPKRIHTVHKTLGITEVDELIAACADGRLAAIKGLGAKTAAKIESAAAWQRQHAERCLRVEARGILEPLLTWLRDQPGVTNADAAGSYRRGCETIGDLDLLAACPAEAAPALHQAFCSRPNVVETLVSGETKSSVRLQEGRQVDLRTVPSHQYAAALLYFTGSKEHNVILRQQAKRLHMRLNEYGLFTGDDTLVEESAATEAILYARLELPYCPPELREQVHEKALLTKTLPTDLLEPDDLRGVLHAHSTWSDGKNSLEEMAEACISAGYEYLGITDHSRTAAYAGGLTIPQVHAQWKEIDTLNQRFVDSGRNFHIFKGIESDILADGSLDYPDDILAGFDFVIGSIHSQMDMEAAAMQARVEAAVRHPATTMLGHPTTRLLLKRKGVALDMEALIRCAAEHGTGIEINCSPQRMELDWSYGPLASELNLLSSVNPDAHAVDQLDSMHDGVLVARKAGFAKDRILNTLPAEDFAQWLQKQKNV